MNDIIIILVHKIKNLVDIFLQNNYEMNQKVFLHFNFELF
jgi:hypothetical protein